jgi:hypothetical protein
MGRNAYQVKGAIQRPRPAKLNGAFSFAGTGISFLLKFSGKP